jgi:hypothetical protein
LTHAYPERISAMCLTFDPDPSGIFFQILSKSTGSNLTTSSSDWIGGEDAVMGQKVVKKDPGSTFTLDEKETSVCAYTSPLCRCKG